MGVKRLGQKKIGSKRNVNLKISKVQTIWPKQKFCGHILFVKNKNLGNKKFRDKKNGQKSLIKESVESKKALDLRIIFYSQFYTEEDTIFWLNFFVKCKN